GAGMGVVRVGAAGGGVAAIVGADVAVVAAGWRAADAAAVLAGVARRAGAAVVAIRPVGLGQGRADAGRRVARAGDVALIQRGTGDGIGAETGAVPAGIRPRARVAVVAGDAVRLRRLGACPRGGIAGPRVVGLV